MFFDADRIPAMREMILSTDVEHRTAALAKLLPMQRSDFEGIYKAMEGRPVTIRLLDPPLHEFLPTAEEDIKALANDMGLTYEYVKATIESLHENNPMMGFRGCRLPVRYPEIAAMQTRAIIEAAINVKAECGYDIVPEIMIPLTCEYKELKYVSNIVKATAEQVKAEKGSDLKYLVGTMIENPARGPHRGRDCQGGRVLQLRHQRPHPDDLRLLPATTPAASCQLLREADFRQRPLRAHRPGRRRQAG